MRCRILVFVRVPRPGLGKTRLAASVGERGAFEASMHLLDKTLAACAPMAELELCHTPDDEGDRVLRWLRPGWSCRPQGLGDLGDRLLRAFRVAFSEGASSALVIGTDCPYLETSDLMAARDAFATHDVVIGPATDGGYWLLGMKRFFPELFQGIPWSTSQVMERTVEQAEIMGLTVHRLRSLTDIDTGEEWEAYLAAKRASRFIGTPPELNLAR